MKYLQIIFVVAILFIACRPTGEWPPQLPLHPSYTGEATFNWWTGKQEWPVRAGYPPESDSLLGVYIARLGVDNRSLQQSFFLSNIPLWNAGDTLTVRSFDGNKTDNLVTSSMHFADVDVLLDSYNIDTTEYSWLVLEHWDPDLELAEISFDLHYIRQDSVGSQPAATRRVHFADGWLSVTVYRE